MKGYSPNPGHYPGIVYAKVLKCMPFHTGLTSSKFAEKISVDGSTSRTPKADADAKRAQEQDKGKAKAGKAGKAAEKGAERKAEAEERETARFIAMTVAIVQQITPTLEAPQKRLDSQERRYHLIVALPPPSPLIGGFCFQLANQEPGNSTGSHLDLAGAVVAAPAAGSFSRTLLVVVSCSTVHLATGMS